MKKIKDIIINTSDFQTILYLFLATSPIFTVLIFMLGFGWGGSKAGPLGWLVACFVSILFFGMDLRILIFSQTRAVLLSLYVLYIIWMSLLLYNVIKQAGVIESITNAVKNLTKNSVIQLLLLSWVFSSFLQGASGFGVPIAIIAPLLIGLGFSPVLAVTSVAIGHSWSVTFGDIATSFNALIASTNMPGRDLAPYTSLLLGIACLLCGFSVAYNSKGFKSLKESWIYILIVGISMSATQYFLSVSGLWNLAGLLSGLIGLVISTILIKLPIFHWTQLKAPKIFENENEKGMPLLMAVVPYILLVLLVLAVELIPFLNINLNHIKLELYFPKVVTKTGWMVEEGLGRTISLFGHPGALLAYTAIISYVIFSFKGRYEKGEIKKIILSTTNSALPSSIGIVAMVGFAMIMSDSGMTNYIAVVLSSLLDDIYPIVSPFIGLLGAFMTGSNTNSNVIFGELQLTTATLLNLQVMIILAAQTTGGSLGSMIAPAKIIVGCSTAGLAGDEGKVIKRTLVFGILITFIIGGITFFLTS